MASSYQPLDELSSAGAPITQHVVVSIPAGTQPGDTLQAKGPDGNSFAFKIPPGTKAPCLIKVEVPADTQSQNVLQIRIPEDAVEGQSIQVKTPGGVSIVCKVPPGARPGSTIFIDVPSTPPKQQHGSVTTREVMVKIPSNVKPGEDMQAVSTDGTRFTFRVPENAQPDTTIKVVLELPSSSRNSEMRSSPEGGTPQRSSAAQAMSSPSMMEPPSSISPSWLVEPKEELYMPHLARDLPDD